MLVRQPKTAVFLGKSPKPPRRQGVLRGSGENDKNGNFMQLLLFRCQDNSTLETWLARKHSFVSWDAQNELLQIMSHIILHNTIRDINTMCVQFGIIVDGAEDVEEKKQESLCAIMPQITLML